MAGRRRRSIGVVVISPVLISHLGTTGHPPKLPNKFQGRPPGTSNMQENFSAAGSSPRTLLRELTALPPDPMAGWVGGGLVPSERDWLDPPMLDTEAPRWISKEGSK